LGTSTRKIFTTKTRRTRRKAKTVNVLLVPKLLLGNREAEAPASRDWKLELGNEYKSKYSVPLFEKEGLGEILLDKSPSIPLFQWGR